MRIVYVTNELATSDNPSAGLANFVSNMARIMDEHDHKVDILYVTTKQNALYLNSSINIENVFIPKSEWEELACVSELLFPGKLEKQKEYRKLLIRIRKAVLVKQKLIEMNKENRIDIVHFSNLLGFSLFMENEIPYVVRISGYDNIYEAGAEKPIAKLGFWDNPLRAMDVTEYRSLKKARFTISPSELCANIGKKELDINPVVIESPFYINKIEYDYSVYSEIKDKKYVFFYGRLNRIKGIHVVAELAHGLLEAKPELFLVIAGNNNEILLDDGTKISGLDYVYNLAGKYRDRVIYLGHITKEKIYPVIENSEVIILPSRMDNLPNACIEAMALGKIVVASRGASYEQIIEDGVSGFLCEIDNANSFLLGINRALDLSDKEKKEMSDNAKRIIDRLSPDRIYQKYIDYYEYVIENW